VSGRLRPAAHLYPEYALNDCRRLARELGLPFLDAGASPPVEHRRAMLDALAAIEGGEAFDDELLGALAAYWRGDAAAVARRAEQTGQRASADAMLARNQRKLQKLGHFNTAMIHYAGEWYWGVDRLHYLTDRLDELGAAREPGLPPRIASIRQVMHLDLPVRPPAAGKSLPPLELFVSFRSPYSYLALSRVYAIADAFGVRLEIRPVLPMVNRGLPVPRAKMRYIVFDAAREARHRGAEFGRFADPLGAGVDRCMAVMRYAVEQNRGREFLFAAGRAIWAKAVDVSTDEGLRKATAKAGLFWPEVKAALEDDAWGQAAAGNLAAMMASGCWGVPVVRIGDWATWGQDRDWLIARHLEELCDSGDGILI
jgi:2-hydroxychromene-2-carboxylate isomerase